MLPVGVRPARSTSFGNMAKTEGVKPRVAAALEEAEKTAIFRFGASPNPARARQWLSGTTVAFLSPLAGALNPHQLAMAGAGARVAAGTETQALLGRSQAPDVVVVDGLTQSAALIGLVLKRLGQMGDLKLVPKLLLVRRSDELELTADRLGSGVAVLATPIRSRTFLQTIRRLAER